MSARPCCVGLALACLGAACADDPPFREVAADVGLEFRHVNGAAGDFHFPEIMGAGVALLDLDGDGDLDVYLVQGAPLGERAAAPPGAGAPTNRLYENQLVPSGALRFRDVTAEVGGGHPGYGMGAAVGDVDGDGDPDLYVTNWGPNALYRNDAGRLVDVVAEAGADDERWNTSAAFLDADLDGDLDLFVVAYVEFSTSQSKTCWGTAGQRDYCSPDSYRPVADRLFRNEGGWRFADVSEATGIAAAPRPGLGVVCADFDVDGRPDVYVANDKRENQLWIARADGAYEDVALVSGAALDADGRAEASMGAAAADFDGDGDEDVFLAHLRTETNTLYQNDGAGRFVDATDRYGLGAASLPYTGFGAGLVDLDNDGALDVFVANGAVTSEESQLGPGERAYAQPNQVFLNELARTGRFGLLARGGPALALCEVSRAAAFGDLDNDGDVDVVVSNNGGPVRLLRNDQTRHAGLSVRLRGRGANADGVGARVALLRPGAPPLWRRAHTDGSYLAASDVCVHFGLGPGRGPLDVAVVWPGGGAEVWRGVAAAGRLTLRQGEGEPWE